ncbi:hypothetical protein OTU49_006006 [Cherax quadricarinatus]|uniref:Cuticle protein n=1 Tax=Cherax quadricarinatus TaxID=27406 RepID=A0AAW0WPH0_CHEQU
MKVLVIICALAVCVNAQVGSSGIVSPDGKNVQFSHDFANSIVLVGPSGIVSANGENLQFTAGQAGLNAGNLPVNPYPYTLYKRIVGPSGIVHPTGRNIQFTQAQADNHVLVGPSGIVSRDGKNIQFD